MVGWLALASGRLSIIFSIVYSVNFYSSSTRPLVYAARRAPGEPWQAQLPW